MVHGWVRMKGKPSSLRMLQGPAPSLELWSAARPALTNCVYQVALRYRQNAPDRVVRQPFRHFRRLIGQTLRSGPTPQGGWTFSAAEGQWIDTGLAESHGKYPRDPYTTRISYRNTMVYITPIIPNIASTATIFLGISPSLLIALPNMPKTTG